MSLDFQVVNEKIRTGEVVVVTAEELLARGRERGYKQTQAKVDVVTTGTFGPMVAAGAFLDLGERAETRRVREVAVNGVPLYHGSGRTPFYIGVSHASLLHEFPRYGGGHVLEALVRGQSVHYRLFRAEWGETEMRKSEGSISLNDIHQATLMLSRWVGMGPFAAVNSSRELLYTEHGALLPRRGNVTYCSAGPLSPAWVADLPATVAFSRRIFLGGAPGQWVPAVNQDRSISTMVGDLARMDARYFRGGYFERFGPVLYLGIGIAVAPLGAEGWESLWDQVTNIKTPIIDMGAGGEFDPVGEVAFDQLASGSIRLGDKNVPTAPLSSRKFAVKVANRVKRWIERGQMSLIDRRPERQGIDDEE